MQAQPHPLERDRLRALEDYQILDTLPESDFDDIVKLASAICGAPVSLISFVDADRQWFKAETGFGQSETSLQKSICAHALHEEEFLEICDARIDIRAQDNPLVRAEGGVRFYAGALLKSEEGVPLGTLCVLDYEPRSLTPVQRDALRVLARQVMSLLEMRRALRTAEILRREVDHRVKNSLQSLSSYTRLQSRSFASPDAKRALSGVATRIDAMTRLHDQLYRSDDESRVDLGRYVEAVAGDLRGLAPLGVSLSAEVLALVATPQQAVAVGTFINEFVTNSYKHAFPNGRAGAVQITLWSPEPGRIELICADDGVGFPPGADQGATGLGMKIVEVVCLELGCENDMHSSPQGLVAKLNFADMHGIIGHVPERAL